MQEKLIGEVAKRLSEEDRFDLLREYGLNETQDCRKLIVTKLKKEIDEATAGEDYDLDKIFEIWSGVAASYFQEEVRKYIENQLPEGYYFDNVSKELKEYKYDIDTRVKCTKYNEYIGYIVGRQDGCYLVVDQKGYDNNTDYYPDYVRPHEGLEIV